MSRVLIIIAIGILAACARYAGAGSESVGNGYATGGGEWNTGGGITAVAGIAERDGVTIVCGAWTTDRQSTLTYYYNYDVMETASVYVDGTRLAQNLGFMERVPYSDDLTGAQANCVASSVPWRPEFASATPELRFPRVIYNVDDEMGAPIIFRETPRPDAVH